MKGIHVQNKLTVQIRGNDVKRKVCYCSNGILTKKKQFHFSYEELKRVIRKYKAWCAFHVKLNEAKKGTHSIQAALISCRNLVIPHFFLYTPTEMINILHSLNITFKPHYNRI